jgi:hypothetical protein
MRTVEITTWEKAKEQIQKWLTEGGETIEEKEDPGANFHFLIGDPRRSPQKQIIIQPKNSPGMILVIMGVVLDPEHVDGLRKMDGKEREAWMWSLQKGIMFNENNYTLEHDADGILKRVMFTYRLYFDALTRHNLHRAMNTNYKSLLYLAGELSNRLGSPPPASDQAPASK